MTCHRGVETSFLYESSYAYNMKKHSGKNGKPPGGRFATQARDTLPGRPRRAGAGGGGGAGIPVVVGGVEKRPVNPADAQA